jgi:hypothetical protein
VLRWWPELITRSESVPDGGRRSVGPVAGMTEHAPPADCGFIYLLGGIDSGWARSPTRRETHARAADTQVDEGPQRMLAAPPARVTGPTSQHAKRLTRAAWHKAQPGASRGAPRLQTAYDEGASGGNLASNPAARIAHMLVGDTSPTLFAASRAPAEFPESSA